MKKELPNIYKSQLSKDNNRNLDVYHVKEMSENRKENSRYSQLTVEQKIKKLFQSSRYIFNIEVKIITNKKEYNTKIAGKVKNSIVTVDGDTIPIIEIEDIIIKDRL